METNSQPGLAFLLLGLFRTFPRDLPHPLLVQLQGPGCSHSTPERLRNFCLPMGREQTPQYPQAAPGLGTKAMRPLYQTTVHPLPSSHCLCPSLPYQVVLGPGYVRVVRPQLPLIDGQCAPVIAFHSLILALVLAQQGQVVQLLCHIRVVGTQDLEWCKGETDGCDSVCVGEGNEGTGNGETEGESKRSGGKRVDQKRGGGGGITATGKSGWRAEVEGRGGGQRWRAEAPFLGSPVPAGTVAPPPCICPSSHRAQPGY